MSDDILIRAEGVSRKFCRSLKRSLWYGVKDTVGDLVGANNSGQALRPDEFWAVNDVSFELKRGECLGLIGHNGAGKTTLLKMLNGLIKPDKGRIEMRGRVGALIALGAGFNPVLTGRENIYVNGAVLGLSKKEIDAKYDEIVDFAEIGDFINSPVQSYSSGMQVRLGFAVATAVEPDVLLLDEVLAVGDAAFRAKCFQRIGRMIKQCAVIFVSHSEAQINRICNRAIMLDAGKLVIDGSAQTAITEYRLRQGRDHNATHVTKDSRLASPTMKVKQRKVVWGGDAVVDIDFQATASVKIGSVFLHISRNGDFVSNGEIDFRMDGGVELSPEDSLLSFRIGPLHLQQGRYTLTFAAFDETGKDTVFHEFDFAEIEIEGPIGSGPPHLIPLTLTR